MKIVIIDDESKARSLLKSILLEHKQDHYLFYEADNLKSGVEIIKNENPQLVFLDIDMPEEQGIELNRHLDLDQFDFELVFATAYSEHALAAFELNASDYILKPLRPNKIIEITEKVESLFKQRDVHKSLMELKHDLNSDNPKKIGVPSQDGIIFIKPLDLIRLEADGMYTKLFIKEKPSLLISKPLKFFSPFLAKYGYFFRAHRSHIINLNFLEEYIRKDGHYLILENNDTVPLSKDRKEAFLQQLLKQD